MAARIFSNTRGQMITLIVQVSSSSVTKVVHLAVAGSYDPAGRQALQAGCALDAKRIQSCAQQRKRMSPARNARGAIVGDQVCAFGRCGQRGHRFVDPTGGQQV